MMWLLNNYLCREDFGRRVKELAQASDLFAGEFFLALDNCGQCCRRDAGGLGHGVSSHLMLFAEKLQHLAVGNGFEWMLHFLVGF